MKSHNELKQEIKNKLIDKGVFNGSSMGADYYIFDIDTLAEEIVKKVEEETKTKTSTLQKNVSALEKELRQTQKAFKQYIAKELESQAVFDSENHFPPIDKLFYEYTEESEEVEQIFKDCIKEIK